MDYLKLLESGIDRWNLWRSENPEDAGDLSGLDLSEGYFFEANFSSTNLSGTNLQRACLIGANLQNANLSRADLNGAYAGNSDLRGANLSQSNLTATNLNQADLRRAILTDANISEAHTYRTRLPEKIKEQSQAERPQEKQSRQDYKKAATHLAARSTSSFENAQNSSEPPSRKVATATALAAPPKALNSDSRSEHSLASDSTTSVSSKRNSPFWSWVPILVNRPVIYTATAIAAILVVGLPFYRTTIQNRPGTNQTTANLNQTENPANSEGQLVSVPSDAPLKLVRSLDSQSEVWAVDTYTDADGRLMVASGEASGQIKIWDAQTGDLMRTLPGHSETVRDLTLSGSGQRLASSSSDGVRVWDTLTGELIYSIPSSGSPIWSVAISPDESTLISGDYDGTVNAYQLDTGDFLYSIANGSTVWSIAIAPDGKSFVTGGKDRAQHWSLADGWPLQEFSGHSADIRSVDISPDGQTLATGSWDKTIKLWDLATGELETTLEDHKGRVVSVAFSNDGTRLASGSVDNTTKLWNLESAELAETLDSTDWVIDVAFAGSEKILISSGKDQLVRLWQ